MKIPAIKSKMGSWDYYITSLTFQQVNDFVSKIDEHLYKSEGLRDIIQRSITNNVESIKDYIIRQEQFFFNALVLAVYDDYPDWVEIDFRYENNETFVMGLLDFPGNHKIFPVDGQHRVEGIKEALKKNPEVGNHKITAIFIGHKNTETGKKRTRRLFTTLNRYAKPVSLDDIIVLDEDDIAAIITRELLEEYDLFTGKRVVHIKQKAIPSNNRSAITSIITLYQANVELVKHFLAVREKKKITKKILDEFLKYRPDENFYNEYKEFVTRFWDAFKLLPVVTLYMKKNDNAALDYRNENGGSIVFRPVGFLPIVKVAIKIHANTNSNFTTIFKKLGKFNLELDQKPWLHVLWNALEKKMIMNMAPLTELLLLYLYDERILSPEELKKLKEGYASQNSIDDAKKIEHILDSLK